MKIDYLNLEKKLKLNFKNKNLLIKSLTHKSYDKQNNNEKLEFLGDRVLGLVMAKRLLEIYPNEKEGTLDKKFASLVNKKTCLEIANKIDLQKYILTYNVKTNKNNIEDKVLADSCEALIGSIYLDKGFQSTEKVILNLWSENIKKVLLLKLMQKLSYKNTLSKNSKNYQSINLFQIQALDTNLYSK